MTSNPENPSGFATATATNNTPRNTPTILAIFAQRQAIVVSYVTRVRHCHCHERRGRRSRGCDCHCSGRGRDAFGGRSLSDGRSRLPAVGTPPDPDPPPRLTATPRRAKTMCRSSGGITDHHPSDGHQTIRTKNKLQSRYLSICGLTRIAEVRVSSLGWWSGGEGARSSPCTVPERED